jgi:hypothetical protein
MKKTIICLFSFVLFAASTNAQQYNKEYIDSLIKVSAKEQVAKTSKFLLSGSAFTTAQFIKGGGSSINDVGLTPILLWQPHKDILVESELEIGFNGSETMVELGYADASFMLNKYLTIRAGKFISPFGIFQDRLHPKWINKLPTVPVGSGEDALGVGPTNEIGIDFNGGAPLGSSKINYSFYVANGAQLVTDTANASMQGTLTYGNVAANNKRMTVGGRIGFLPFPASTLELGFSYRNGKVGDQNSIYQNVGAQMYALDFTYVEQLDFLRGMLDVKAQYNNINVDKADYIDPVEPTGSTTYTFDNKRNSLFAQAAYRPTMLPSKLFKRTEFVFRYAEFNPPIGTKGLEVVNQYTYGIDYWLTWRTVFKAAYQSQRNNDAFFLQVAVGF